jgi:hypothetical protein
LAGWSPQRRYGLFAADDLLAGALRLGNAAHPFYDRCR